MTNIKLLLAAALFMGSATMVTAQVDDLEPVEYKTRPFTLDKNKKQRQPGGTKSKGYDPQAKMPDHLNNALLKYFPPIFNQDHGSCEAAAYIGYQWTYERNNYYDLDAQYPETRFATHFNFLLTHSGQGTFQPDLIQHVGNATEADYGGQTFSKYYGSQDCKDRNYGWMQGYDKWYRTAFNRDWTYAFFEDRVTSEAGREAVKRWLWNHDGDYDYNAGGVVWVGVNITGADVRAIPSTPTNRSLGVVGKRYMHEWASTGGHAMTIVGYDDRIEFDIDGNGIYGEKDKDEVGAWIIANSWGDGWEDNGFVYCPYRCCTPKTNNSGWNVKRHFIRKDYEPQRMIKLKLAFSRRSALQLSVGVAQDTAATQADYTMTMHHFNYAGDGLRDTYQPPLVPMLGKWIDGYHYEPMEFGYDLTDMTNIYDRHKPLKYFFTIRTQRNLPEEWQGTGRLYEASVIDYEFDRNGMEFPFRFDKLDIGGTDNVYTISVVVPGEQVNAPLNLNANIDGTLSWEAPVTTSLPLKQYYIYYDGCKLDSVSSSTCTYTPHGDNLDKPYAVAAAYQYNGRTIVSAMSNPATIQSQSSSTDNVVLEMKHTMALADNVGFQAAYGATLEYWIKPYSLNDYAQQLGNDGFIFLALTKNNTVRCGIGPDKAVSSYGNSEIKLNEWNHVAYVRKGFMNYVYINGKRMNASGDSNVNGILPFSTFSIGRDPKNGLINGQVDEIRLWNRPLTEQEIQNNRLSEIATPSIQSDLVLYYKGNTFEDADGNLCIRDYARGHHAVVRDADSVKSVINNTLLNGGATPSVSINIPDEPVYTNTPTLFSAIIPACATGVKWIIDGKQDKVSTQASPYLTFDKAGNHSVQIIAQYGNSKQVSSIQAVSVTDAPMPVADFEIAQNNLPASEPFSFINRSNAINATYKWTMPGADPEEINATNASARFLEVGSYPVTLTVTNDAGTSSITKEVTAVASAPAPDFEVSPSAILIGDKVFFEDKTIYDPEEWQWEINHVSGKRNYAIHAQNTAFTPQAPGYYNLTLKARNAQGQTAKTQRKAFAVSNADPGNALAFYGDGEQISIPSPFAANTRAFTIDAWLNPSNYDGIMAGTTNDAKVKTYSNPDGSLTLEISGKSVTSDPGYFILDEWHHYAVTFSTGNVKFYRDAELITAPTLRLSLNCPAWTGSVNLSSAEHRYKGLIDEFRIWSKSLNQKTIQSYANQPIATDDIETAKSSNGLLLYYDFNQNGSDVIDRTGNEHTGVRKDFSGADGDAWTSALGVFTLDFEGDEPSDVTADYLTNYKAPFLDNGEPVSTTNANNLRGLLTDDEKSTWKIEGAMVSEKSTTGAHVAKSMNSDLNFRTGYYGFADTLKNHRLYQTVTLPAGYYTLSVSPSEGGAWVADSSLICIVRGDEFVDMLTYEDKAEAYAPLSDGKITFTVGEEEPITIGLIINLTGWNAIDINEFRLMRTPVTEVDPDDETSVYDAVRSGDMPRYTPMANAIRVINEEKRPMLVYTLDGRLVFREDVEGVHIIPFAPGIYVIDGQKIQVK